MWIYIPLIQHVPFVTGKGLPRKKQSLASRPLLYFFFPIIILHLKKSTINKPVVM